MGLLDDAIREHLELKRNRGADPSEVARQEEEALGDPRGPAPDTEADGDLDEPFEADPEPDPAPGPDLEAAGLLPGEPLPEVAEEAPVPHVAEEPEDDAPWLDDDALEGRPRAPEPEPPTAEQASAARTPEEDEDVLEDTPDFLQDTPEHDRLWFEQRPPRDFDFDA